jgi:hypothetical protein
VDVDAHEFDANKVNPAGVSRPAHDGCQFAADHQEQGDQAEQPTSPVIEVEREAVAQAAGVSDL